jgi:alpha/beta superfamily hydrolase
MFESENTSMKFTLLFLFITIEIQLVAQCDQNRYLNFVFPETVSTSDVQYGENVNYQGANESLYMDVYEPSGDELANRPLVIMCHGGYFLSGDKAAPDMLPLCTDLARMGYVVASINYRVGIPFGTALEVPYGQALLRALQDVRAAIRWFRKNADTEGNTYRINPDQIFVGGASAGGFMALHLAYMDENEIPSWLDMSIPGLEGGLEGESGNPGYSSEVSGILPVSGAMGDSDWIDAGDTTPACMFHGDADLTVTIDSATFVLFGLINVTTIEGSNYIADRMNQVGVEHCYYVTPGGGHVPYLGNATEYDMTLSLMSGFLHGLVCGEAFDCTYHEILSNTDEIVGSTQMKVYPNPANYQIFLPEATSKTLSALYTLDGRKVADITGSTFDTSTLAEGIYVLDRIGTEGVLVRERVVIAH